MVLGPSISGPRDASTLRLRLARSASSFLHHRLLFIRRPKHRPHRISRYQKRKKLTLHRLHVAPIARHPLHCCTSPLAVWTSLRLGKDCTGYGFAQDSSYVFVISFRLRRFALHSSLSSLALDFCHRARRLVPHSRRLRARYRL